MRNFTFMRHTFLVVTVKRRLKSVYIYGSYRKIKTGVTLFWTTLSYFVAMCSRRCCIVGCVICVTNSNRRDADVISEQIEVDQSEWRNWFEDPVGLSRQNVAELG